MRENVLPAVMLSDENTRFRAFEKNALRTDGRTDGRTDRRTDGQTLL